MAALQDYDIDKLAHSLQVQGFAQGDILVAVAIFEMFRGRAESGLRLMEQSESHEILEPGASFERLFYLAWGDYRSGKHRDALVKLEQAAALKPGDPALLNNKGVVLRRLGEPSDMSRDCWEKSLLLFPGYMDAEHNLTQADTDNLKYTSRILEAARVRRNTYNTN
ncbi:hypothetical protein [Cohnella rhizosphaerae]|uniref:Tetratricopeptide repeat protein n=1 Tax=Cohnella rhizosphaerae TaxID=1457232 RepID=A0A9X4QVW3_9BACL|nr:hypothetical protein [Cohnella rhizosphaerae]MDG0811887.1 hypothetical protein [Cohnella rhizosphaerae]